MTNIVRRIKLQKQLERWDGALSSGKLSNQMILSN